MCQIDDAAKATRFRWPAGLAWPIQLPAGQPLRMDLECISEGLESAFTRVRLRISSTFVRSMLPEADQYCWVVISLHEELPSEAAENGSPCADAGRCPCFSDHLAAQPLQAANARTEQFFSCGLLLLAPTQLEGNLEHPAPKNLSRRLRPALRSPAQPAIVVQLTSDRSDQVLRSADRLRCRQLVPMDA